MDGYSSITISHLESHHRCRPAGWADTCRTPWIQHPDTVVGFVLDLVCVAADTDNRFVRVGSRPRRVCNSAQPVITVKDDSFRTGNCPLDEVDHSMRNDERHATPRKGSDRREIETPRIGISVDRCETSRKFSHVCVCLSGSEVAGVNDVIRRFDMSAELVGYLRCLLGDMHIREYRYFHVLESYHDSKTLADAP